MEEILKYKCEECNYVTHDKSNYNKHFRTQKHVKNSMGNYVHIEIIEKKNYKCKYCDGIFNNRTSLWRHKKKCALHKEKKVVTIMKVILNVILNLIKLKKTIIQTIIQTTNLKKK